jgi:hypothetical protein
MKDMSALCENLDDELIGVNQKNILKMLDWLYDNRFLNFDGNKFNQYYATRLKIKEQKSVYKKFGAQEE